MISHPLVGRLLLVLGSIAVGSRVPAQSPTVRVVEDCARCPVVLEMIGQATDEDASIRRYNHQVASTGDGRFVVIPKHLSKLPPAIFSYTGRRLGSLGKRGEGPGEVGAVSWLNVLPGGNLQLISRTRVNEFRPDGTLARAYTLRTEVRGTSGVRVGSGPHFVANSIVIPNSGDLNPLYVFGEEGRLVRTLSRPDDRLQPAFRAVGPAAAPRGEVYWVAERLGQDASGFSLRLQDVRGEVRTHLRFEPRWFRETARESGLVTALPHNVHETADGNLLVLVGRPMVTFGQYLKNRYGNPRDFYDTVLLVFDPRSSKVIGSQSIAGYPQAILDDRHIVTSSADEDDVPTLTVWRLGGRSNGTKSSK